MYKNAMVKQSKGSKRLVMGAWAFFLVQFGLGYHCIFNVEYLGWDLVEPMTYTIA